MSPHRLARLSETNEENDEDDDATKPCKELTMRSPRSANNLHVTINSKPEELEYCSDGIGAGRKTPMNEEGAGRRPSALIQDILSTRRPSAIMAAIRSPKQFVTRYRREYERIVQYYYYFFRCFHVHPLCIRVVTSWCLAFLISLISLIHSQTRPSAISKCLKRTNASTISILY